MLHICHRLIRQWCSFSLWLWSILYYLTCSDLQCLKTVERSSVLVIGLYELLPTVTKSLFPVCCPWCVWIGILCGHFSHCNDVVCFCRFLDVMGTRSRVSGSVSVCELHPHKWVLLQVVELLFFLTLYDIQLCEDTTVCVSCYWLAPGYLSGFAS